MLVCADGDASVAFGLYALRLHGSPVAAGGGSILIEIVLWCFFLIPGLIYSLWRLGSKDQVCPSCQRPAMIPAFSPKRRGARERQRRVVSER